MPRPARGRRGRGGGYSSAVPFGLGIWEILILAGVLVLLFGAKGAPGMAKRLGVGVREMKDAVSEMDPRSLLDPKSDKPKPSSRPGKELEAAKPPVQEPSAVPATPTPPVAAAPPADEAPPS